MGDVIQLPGKFTVRLSELFPTPDHPDLTILRSMDIHELRTAWDEIGDNSFYDGPLGFFDCADIHRVLNEKGDGHYCAV